jgi:hypothetical protein
MRILSNYCTWNGSVDLRGSSSLGRGDVEFWIIRFTTIVLYCVQVSCGSSTKPCSGIVV